MQETTPETNYAYFKQLWEETTPEKRRTWKWAGLLLALLWLAGAGAAFSGVAGIARLGGGARLLSALVMGPFGLLWAALKWTGMISETSQTPNLLWLLLAGINVGIIWLAGKILGGTPNPQVQQQRRHQAAERAQGRLAGEKIAARLGVKRGALAANVAGKKGETVTVGVDYATGEGHMLVVGPTRSGKGLNLTQTLLFWPGPAVIVDPKGEQLARTAGSRRRQFAGPIYRLPGHRLPLAPYYDRLLDRDSVLELHHHLLRPWQSRERIFADKSRALFTAAGHYAAAHGLDPVRVLLDAAEGDPAQVLAALETVPAARRHVRLFTDGLPPDGYQENRFATSAYGTFTTMLGGYQKHAETIAPEKKDTPRIPPDWAARNGTIYITYSLEDLQGAGGVVAAIMAALMRYQMGQGRRERVLVAIDELPAVGLHNVTTYLATAGGYGITLLLYAQAISQLRGLYGREGTQSILANCAHQVWYPPADAETARVMADLYGTSYQASHTQSTARRFYQGNKPEGEGAVPYVDTRYGQGWQLRPALQPVEMMGLPKETVMVLMQKERQYRFLGERLNPISAFEHLAPPPSLPPPPSGGERAYTAWATAAETPAPAPPPDERGEPPPDGLAGASHL